MTETLPRLLLRLSEAGDPAILWGRQASSHAGRDFERLLDHGVLVEQTPATEWDVCPACDCGLDARPIHQVNGRHIAVCPTDRRNDVVLGADDLRSFRIHPSALVREIAMASGFGGTPAPVAAGVWHLGETSDQRALFLALSRDAVLQPGMIGLMRSAARSSPIIVIAPAMAADELARFVEAAISVMSIDGCLGRNATGFAIDLSKLESAATFEPRLVIFRQSQRVILDGIEMHIPQQPFKLLVILAEAVGTRKGHLTPQEIEAENSGRSAGDLIRDLRNALHDDQKTLIRTRQSPTRYFLGLAAGEFDLRP
ncbi:hypothetical protein MIC97_01510 [Aquamicrobium sp. NLF2-7]|uniref:hypothetical protein n=1 Tax=Aquamicrobium sp. NLF2-7 TaxID=2918753 RepID=UPI001EFB82B8|nr:hypothetical protein [Aquamicrobium sp. NLF2-7]MCG8270190.1 hypothetical protein [Aquamicrobium sp. NLF2-7]